MMRPVSESPPTATPKMPAKTGSMVITTAARAGGRCACAQVWMKNATAVAAIAVSRTAPQTPASGGGASDDGAAMTIDSTATVPSCTTASPAASYDEDHSPSPTM